jgi:DNA-binding response OmpR family regulator
MARTILVADDEPKMVALIKGYLEASGFRVIQAFDGIEALKAFRDYAPDCLVLDVNMPGMDGLSLARELRKVSEAPIIFLTALADELDRVVGLELGADDYVTKPFSPRELVARVKAVLRRSGPREGQAAEAASERLVRGDLVLDLSKRSCSVGQRAVSLTAAQFDMLALMMRRPGKVWARLELLEGSSGSTHEGYERTVDAQVKNIRKALGDEAESPRYIETVRGVGYRFKEPGVAD